MRKIGLIVALTNNYVIGREHTVPWYLPNDMIWFRLHTLYKPVIMGRRTFESLGKKLLIDRFNIILSRNTFKKFLSTNFAFVNTPEEALYLIEQVYSNVPEIMIIGGREIYNIFFPYVNRLYLTCLDISICGDTFFPYYRVDNWKIIFNELHFFKSINGCSYNYSFKIFQRV